MVYCVSRQHRELLLLYCTVERAEYFILDWQIAHIDFNQLFTVSNVWQYSYILSLQALKVILAVKFLEE